MGTVIAGITTSVDGYVAGPTTDRAPGSAPAASSCTTGSSAAPGRTPSTELGDPVAEDQEWLERMFSELGAVVGGRWTYEASGHWGGTNPWGKPFFIVTHRPEEQPAGDDFVFVDGVAEAVARAQGAAGDKPVHVMGGADVIRQALAADLVDELTIIIAPVVLGGGKRLFEGFDRTVQLEHPGVRQSPYATFVDYRVVR